MIETEDQQLEAIKSLAVELNRLAHVAPAPSEQDSNSNIVFIVQALTKLCRNNAEGLAKLMLFLVELQDHDDANQDQEVH